MKNKVATGDFFFHFFNNNKKNKKMDNYFLPNQKKNVKKKLRPSAGPETEFLLGWPYEAHKKPLVVVVASDTDQIGPGVGLFLRSTPTTNKHTHSRFLPYIPQTTHAGFTRGLVTITVFTRSAI